MERPNRNNTVIPEARKDLLSYEDSEIINIVNIAFLSTAVCIFGIAASIINIVIFCKQGFSCTINISLLGLSISDLCVLITDLYGNIGMNPLLRKADLPFVSDEVIYLLAGAPSLVFSRISGWITVFITAERCVGIASPLKVKAIITSKRTAAIITTIYILNIMSVTTEYLTYKLDWKFYSGKNRTLYGLVMNRSDEATDILSYVINSFIGYTSFLALFIFTAILVIKLIQKSAWRQKATLANTNSDSMSDRDKKAMKLIVLIAAVTIASYTPGAIIIMTMSFDQDFSVLGIYRETFMAVWSFPFLFQTINSSVNIFLYYSMSTKYRQTFLELFRICNKQE